MLRRIGIGLYEIIKNTARNIDFVEVKNILFEYSVLVNCVLIIIFVGGDMYNRLLALAMFIIYIRHYHKGEKVVIRKSKYSVFTEKISKPKSLYSVLFPPIMMPTVLITVLFLSEIFNLTLSLIVFILWFIVTDIYRTRRCMYGIYISRWFFTSKININNSKWRMHKADIDPFPSVPHMHAIDRPLKLDIYSGGIYDVKTKKLIETANNKDLRKLWADSKFKTDVNNARIVYMENNPSYSLREIPIFNKK